MAVGSAERRFVSFDPEVIEALRASLRDGLPLTDTYACDAARGIWNGMIDKQPALIVQSSYRDSYAWLVEITNRYDLTDFFRVNTIRPTI